MGRMVRHRGRPDKGHPPESAARGVALGIALGGASRDGLFQAETFCFSHETKRRRRLRPA
jgi:hypothetical protein